MGKHMNNTFLKGVSPVIATIILIIISIAAGALLWMWVSGFISSPPPQIQSTWQERIKIEAINIVSNREAKIYVRNLGNVAVNIASAYILTVEGTAIDIIPIEPAISIEPQKVKEISLKISNPTSYKPGYTYIAKVVTTNGVEANYGFIWPALTE